MVIPWVQKFAAMRILESIWLDRNSRFTLQEQLVRQIKEYVQQERLKRGEVMPSTSELASELKLSRNTVVYAYERLESEGYLESHPRSGVVVSSTIFLSPHSKWPVKTDEAVREMDSRSHALRSALRTPSPFRPCQPDVNLFEKWKLRGNSV